MAIHADYRKKIPIGASVKIRMKMYHFPEGTEGIVKSRYCSASGFECSVVYIGGTIQAMPNYLLEELELPIAWEI